jgi:hypothetical protein
MKGSEQPVLLEALQESGHQGSGASMPTHAPSGTTRERAIQNQDVSPLLSLYIKTETCGPVH